MTQPTPIESAARKKFLRDRARFMRANPTDAERRLWNMVRAKRFGGLKWKRQQIIDDLFIVDFVCFEFRLIIEADGSQHADSVDDMQRDAYLKAQGFHVLRFWNNDILAHASDVAERIFAVVCSLTAQTRGIPLPSAATGTHQSNTLIGPSRLPPSPARGEGFESASHD